MPLALADRTASLLETPFRRIFELSRQLANPINFGLGQPDFDVPVELKQVAMQAVEKGINGYTVASGNPELRATIKQSLNGAYTKNDDVIITSGTMGALTLALQAIVNPGDEVILLDPYFVAYPQVVRLVEGVAVYVSTYPDLQPDVDRIRQAITPKTKAILLCSPGNPTGVVAEPARVKALAKLADERGVLLISDEIYASFVYDEPFVSPASFGANVLVCTSFSKTHGMTGWRVGYAYGPPHIIQAMIAIQQSTFVCAPSMAQVAAQMAWTYPMDDYVAQYRKKRDYLVKHLDPQYEAVKPGGGFYLFPKAPAGTGSSFVEKALGKNLVMMPGMCFSQQDSHFRISYAVDDVMLARGVEVLNGLVG
jgi:aspartate aminotransferase/aminotransferase